LKVKNQKFKSLYQLFGPELIFGKFPACSFLPFKVANSSSFSHLLLPLFASVASDYLVGLERVVIKRIQFASKNGCILVSSSFLLLPNSVGVASHKKGVSELKTRHRVARDRN
jgi:hypothetical protein